MTVFGSHWLRLAFKKQELVQIEIMKRQLSG
jgi:hypothetical protein